MGNTYRQLINVFRARAENRYAQFIHETPQVGRVVERAAVVQNERAADGEPTYEEVPHHPAPAAVTACERKSPVKRDVKIANVVV